MVTQVRMVENFSTDKKWIFIGERIEDPLFYNCWSNPLLYGGSADYYINAYSRREWILKYLGVDIQMADDDVADSLKKDIEVKEMSCWPNSGSIKVIGENIVIKLQNVE